MRCMYDYSVGRVSRQCARGREKHAGTWTPVSLTYGFQNSKSPVRPEELKLIRDMRRRNPKLGMIEFWWRLKQRGYTRRPESLFRGMRKLGIIPAKKPRRSHKSKPYEQMLYPGQRVQIDVKVY